LLMKLKNKCPTPQLLCNSGKTPSVAAATAPSEREPKKRRSAKSLPPRGRWRGASRASAVTEGAPPRPHLTFSTSRPRPPLFRRPSPPQCAHWGTSPREGGKGMAGSLGALLGPPSGGAGAAACGGD
jgi:hypothetical protein